PEPPANPTDPTDPPTDGTTTTTVDPTTTTVDPTTTTVADTTTSLVTTTLATTTTLAPTSTTAPDSSTTSVVDGSTTTTVVDGSTTTTVDPTTTTVAPTSTTAEPTTTTAEPTTTTESTTTTTEPGNTPPPLTSSSDEIAHIIRRLTFGATPALRLELDELGIEAWLAQQLDPASIDDGETEAILANGYPSLTGTNAQNSQRGHEQNEHELLHARIVRALTSKRQLFEVLVDFWSNHFSISLLGDGRWTSLKNQDERDVIRANALGTFADMLLASAHSPAMLRYLDNYRSNANSDQGVNENWGREILELHTFGLWDGTEPYTQDDVIGVSQVMSGWSINESNRQDTFEFKANYHYTGPVSILGGAWSTAGSSGQAGYQDGVSLMNFLARRPETARHLAYKLTRNLVADEPPAALIESAAQVYLANDTAIAPVVQHIVTSPAFMAARGSKFRKPFELLMAALRALESEVETGAQSTAAERLRTLLRNIGHHPYAWSTPDGYPDVAEYWTSSAGLLERWGLTARLANNSIDGIRTDLRALLPEELPATAGELVDYLIARLVDVTPSDVDRAAALAFFEKAAADPVTEEDLDDQRFRSLVGLLLCTPSFQLR
ncbi:MAG: DUF1800 domain-containing protein, partial [Actinomycetota bacterium]|nr:DUF1800 domain-containing protein [Actinomycetota bacterium]